MSPVFPENRASLDPRKGVSLCLLSGVILFSGSIYALAAGAPGWMGPVTPVGGLVLLAGWLWLAFRVVRQG